MSVTVNMNINEVCRVQARRLDPVRFPLPTNLSHARITIDNGSEINLFGTDTQLEGIALGIIEQLREQAAEGADLAESLIEQGIEDLRIGERIDMGPSRG